MDTLHPDEPECNARDTRRVASSRPDDRAAEAAKLADCGAFIVPCHFPRANGDCSCGDPSHNRDLPKSSCGKHPVGSKWQERASNDPDEVRRMFAGAARRIGGVPNIGVVLNTRTRMAALDVDSEAGERLLDELSGGEIPPTWETRSGRGRHLIFRIPEGVEPKTVSLKDEAGEEALRFMGGQSAQLVVPPSLHKAGRLYQWAEGRAPWEVPLADMSEWMLKKMCPPPPPEHESHAAPRGTNGEAAECTPWGDFNKRGDWHKTLIAAGYQFAYSTDGGVSYYRRPGKSGGHSVSLGYCKASDGTPALWVWSGSIPYLDPEKSYDLFGFVSRWKYGGEFGDCASALRTGEYDGVCYGRVDPVAVLGEPDVKEATEQGCSVLPEDGQTVGKDGAADTAPSPLSAAHLQYLAERGIPAETALAAVLHTVTSPKAAAGLLKRDVASKKWVPCLAIPYHDATGKPLNYARVILDKPRKKAGKPIAVESPLGLSVGPYLPPHAAQFLGDATAPVIVVVGELLSLAADAAGLNCIGLPHPWAWRTDDGLSPVLAGAAWEKRSVYLSLEGDAGDNSTPAAETSLAKELSRLGADVRVLRVPAGDEGETQSLGEFITAGRDVCKLFETAVFPEDADPRPKVFTTVEIHIVAQRVREHLAKVPGLYSRGRVLVREVPEMPGRLIPVPADAMPELLSERFRFATKVVKAEGIEEKRVPPPSSACKSVFSNPAAPIPEVENVVTYPVMLADGRILSRSDYDPESRTLVRLPAGLTLDVPDNPTKEDARRAAEVLFEPFSEFPFVDEDDEPDAEIRGKSSRAGVLAIILALVARPAINSPCPMTLVTKNSPATGGSLLLEAIGMLVTGEPFPVYSYTDDKAEMGKLIATLAIEGHPVAHLDNLTGEVGGSELNKTITARKGTYRVLGSSKTFTGTLNTLFVGSGNNCTLGADMPRRVQNIRMRVTEERPEERKFNRNLREFIPANRSRLLSAALTILKAYIVAGRPKASIPNWGMFDGYSAIVRQSLVFAGQADPYKPAGVGADHRKRMLKVLACGMQEMDQEGKGLTAAEIVRKLRDDAYLPETLQFAYDALSEIMTHVNSVSLGKILATEKDRNLGGMMISESPNRHRTNMALWVVKTITQKPAENQDEDEISPAPPASDQTIEDLFAGGAGDKTGVQSSTFETRKREFVNNPNRDTVLDKNGGAI